MNRRNFLYVSGIAFTVSSVNPWLLLSQKDTMNGKSKFDEIIAISQKETWSKLSLNLIIIKY